MIAMVRIWMFSMEIPGSNSGKFFLDIFFYSSVIVLLEYLNTVIYSSFIYLLFLLLAVTYLLFKPYKGTAMMAMLCTHQISSHSQKAIHPVAFDPFTQKMLLHLQFIGVW